MERYKSKFQEETPAPAPDQKLGATQKVANPGQQATGNLKQGVKDVQDDKKQNAQLDTTASKLFKSLVGKAVFSPKNGVMLIFSEDGIKVGNVKTNKILADLSFADLKFKK